MLLAQNNDNASKGAQRRYKDGRPGRGEHVSVTSLQKNLGHSEGHHRPRLTFRPFLTCRRNSSSHGTHCATDNKEGLPQLQCAVPVAEKGKFQEATVGPRLSEPLNPMIPS